MDPTKGDGVGRNNRDPSEVIRQVSVDSLCRSSNVAQSGLEIYYVDRPVGWRVHGNSVGGTGKQVSVKTPGTSEHLRKA